MANDNDIIVAGGAGLDKRMSTFYMWQQFDQDFLKKKNIITPNILHNSFKVG